MSRRSSPLIGRGQRVGDPHVHLELDDARRVGPGPHNLDDYPLDHPAESLAALGEYGFDQAEHAAITHDNAASLFGLDG